MEESNQQMHEECVKKVTSSPLYFPYYLALQNVWMSAILVDDEEMLVMIKVIKVQNMKKKANKKKMLPVF